MDFCGARDYIIERLRAELRPVLYYHCVEHTLDVYEATNRLILAENIEEHKARLLETAALFHDSGILFRYIDHERASVDLAKKILPGYNYTPGEIDFIGEMIMITSLPQRPASLEAQILCDADLDYLGRKDFFIHSFELRLEWQIVGIKNVNLFDWLVSQVKFLSEHHYFTKSAINTRNEQKQKNLEEVKQLLQNFSPVQ